MSFLLSLASKRALFTTASKDSHSRRLEWWDGSRCSRLWRMDSSWMETGERLTWKTGQLSIITGLFLSKARYLHAPIESLLTLLKRDEKTSWWSFMLIPSHIFNNSSSSSVLNSSNVSHWIIRSSSSMSLQYYSTDFHRRALHWFSGDCFLFLNSFSFLCLSELEVLSSILFIQDQGPAVYPFLNWT